MKPGEFITAFQDKKGRTISVTALSSKDADDLLVYANTLIHEDTFILLSGNELTKKYEDQYVKETLKQVKEKKKIHLIARIQGTLVSSFEIRRYALRKSHVGEVGISIVKAYRNCGIGRQCFGILIDQAKKLGLRMLVLTCFANNERAMHLYESVGFRKTGLTPQAILYKGNYVDEVAMCLPLV